MGELISLEDYRAKKKSEEEGEIAALQAELRDLIKDMGGIHMVPIMYDMYSGVDSLLSVTSSIDTPIYSLELWPIVVPKETLEDE